MNGKPWWSSKTLWWNVLSGLVLVLKGKFPQFDIPMEVFAAIVIVVNFILRWVTKEKIEIS